MQAHSSPPHYSNPTGQSWLCTTVGIKEGDMPTPRVPPIKSRLLGV